MSSARLNTAMNSEEKKTDGSVMKVTTSSSTKTPEAEVRLIKPENNVQLWWLGLPKTYRENVSRSNDES